MRTAERGLLLPTLCLLACCTSARAGDPLPALIKRVTPGIVTVVAYNTDLVMPGVGTGFFVGPDRVVTARHVLARADRAAVRTSGGRSIPIAGILAEQRASDLVLIQLQRPAEGARVLAVAAEAPEVGERLFTVGSPLGLEYTASDGIVSAYREVPDAGVSMQHTVPVSAGSSGCPLLNERGEVVAVQTGVITAGQKTVHAGHSLSFAVSAGLVSSLEPGKLRTLPECAGDLPADWTPPITRGIDAISLHPLSRQDFRSALRFFQEDAKEQPDEPDVWFRLGLCHEKLGELDEAVTHYQKALSLNPTFASAWNNLGAVHIRRGENDKAAEALRRAVKSKPDYGPAYGNLAVACVQARKWPEAADAARNALRLSPDDAEARLNLGTASARLGDQPEAQRQYEALLPTDRPRAERLKVILDSIPAAGG